jgi:ADP-ribose pyrophosphatase
LPRIEELFALLQQFPCRERLRLSKLRAVPPHDDLPPPPRIALAVVRDRTPEARATGGFLNVARLDLVATYPDGSKSPPFPYDVTTRDALDAVVFAAHFVKNGARHVFLRSALRPPCALRPVPPAHDGSLWELPAGLIDEGETAAEAAARELLEELGAKMPASAMKDLGPWMFPAPGMCGERHVFFHVEVDPAACVTPSEDGSALERHARIVTLPVQAAVACCRTGAIRDSKTELALRRLAELP